MVFAIGRRGRRRESFHVDSGDASRRTATQLRCARSLVKHMIEPYEATGHRVSVFLTIYERLWGPKT